MIENEMRYTSFEDIKRDEYRYWHGLSAEARLKEILGMHPRLLYEPDYRDLLRALSRNGVQYLIIGGQAVSYHAQWRYTKDLDIFVNPAPDNAMRLYQALAEAGFAIAEHKPEDFTEPDKYFRFGVSLGVDVMTSVPGIAFDEVWPSRTVATLGDLSVNFIGREDLITAKRASGRLQDLADIEAIEAAKEATE